MLLQPFTSMSSLRSKRASLAPAPTLPKATLHTLSFRAPPSTNHTTSNSLDKGMTIRAKARTHTDLTPLHTTRHTCQITGPATFALTTTVIGGLLDSSSSSTNLTTPTIALAIETSAMAAASGTTTGTDPIGTTTEIAETGTGRRETVIAQHLTALLQVAITPIRSRDPLTRCHLHSHTMRTRDHEEDLLLFPFHTLPALLALLSPYLTRKRKDSTHPTVTEEVLKTEMIFLFVFFVFIFSPKA